MAIRSVFLSILAVSLLGVIGCGGSAIGDGDASSRDTAVTNSLGEAYLSYDGRSETVVVSDTYTDAPISGVQVFGMTDFDRSLYLAADPGWDYHPVITSGKASSYSHPDIFMTPVDWQSGSNATMYQDVDGGLLHDFVLEYGSRNETTTIAGLRNRLAALASGEDAGLVVCVNQPLTSYTGQISATEIAQQSNDLSTAFQAIGWQYLYTSQGFTTDQQVTISLIDPYALNLYHGSAGALEDTLIAVVAPTTIADGPATNTLRVEVTWDKAVDLDLHLVRNYANLYSSLNDCYWKYREQNWGDVYSTSDNPRLLIDNTNGYGPEKIVMDEMTPGETYTVAVDYWGDPNGRPTHTPVTATVRVWTNGSTNPRTFTESGFTYGAPENGQYEIVCDINGTTGEVTFANRSMTREASRSVGMKQY